MLIDGVIAVVMWQNIAWCEYPDFVSTPGALLLALIDLNPDLHK